MRKSIAFFIAFSALTIAAPASAQRLWLRPFYGYLKTSMTELNDLVEEQILGWREVLNEPIPLPEKINGNGFYGGEVAYDFADNYSISLGLYYYKEDLRVDYANASAALPLRFNFEREVRLYDIFFNLRYHFTEVAFTRFNPYVGFGGSIALAKAKSNTQHFVTDPQTNEPVALSDTQGDFSENSKAQKNSNRLTAQP